MKLLVTGGYGFIGSNFLLYVLKNFPKYEIVNLDAEFYGSNKLNLPDLTNNEKYRFVKANINDRIIVNKLVADSDVVINFAAESFVDRSIADAAPFIKSNIDGVFVLLEAARKYKKKFIQISTDEVYCSLETGTASENSIYNPTSPYAATKACAEMLINSFHKTYGLETLITRCTNNFGPRQFPEKLIPKTIILATQNKKIPVYGTGTNLRDWLYVDDHCDAIFSIFLKGKTGESYNISSNNELDNLTIINKILSMMNKTSDLLEFVEDRPGHDFRYSMSSQKIRHEIGWKPKANFEKRLQNTVDWYLNNPEWWKHLSKNIFTATPWKK